jgi:hypothetical protein
MTIESDHKKLESFWEEYKQEYDRLVTSGVKASASRARKALGEFKKLAVEQRKNITEFKDKMPGKSKKK